MKPVPRWFLALCWAMAVLFSLCVGLQANDPDPARWMALYGAAALACAVLPARRFVAIGAAVIGLIAAAWGAYLAHQVIDVLSFSDLFMKMDEKGGAVEVGREAGGLAIVAAMMLGGAGFRAMRA
ncbi:MAG TPA: transmembrane 220 family protein [Kofleriaceae bacterium]|nr:transmembrane 220 family protein [Kofleriaceae bacterium]